MKSLTIGHFEKCTPMVPISDSQELDTYKHRVISINLTFRNWYHWCTFFKITNS